MAVTLTLAFGSVSAAAVTAPAEALAQSLDPVVPTVPVPQDARDGGTQRWAPPLAGTSAGVDLSGGMARLTSARDGRADPASLRSPRREGLLDLGQHRFGSPVNRFTVPVDADVPRGSAVEVDVRGHRADGSWSEWAPATPGAPAVLDEPTRVVGVRLVLLGAPDAATPVVRTLNVLADQVPTGPRTVEPRASYRVYATREGLVGGTTANGHVIRPNDQFVALPNRRALSPNGRGDYSVRICSDLRRCATVPVWDIGPWNINDDYWNGGPRRQAWQDLAFGLPQAQAAYQNRHNGGRDGSGRRVNNPAGIDLADGTFAGLGLKDNGWVSVEYLWTGGGTPSGQVVSPAGPLPLRPGPSPLGDVGVIGDGARVDVQCQLPGPPVAGSQGLSNLWFQVAPGQFTPAAFVTGTPPVPACPTAAPAPAPILPIALPAPAPVALPAPIAPAAPAARPTSAAPVAPAAPPAPATPAAPAATAARPAPAAPVAPASRPAPVGRPAPAGPVHAPAVRPTPAPAAPHAPAHGPAPVRAPVAPPAAAPARR